MIFPGFLSHKKAAAQQLVDKLRTMQEEK